MKSNQITGQLNIQELYVASRTPPSQVCKLFKFADFKNSNLQVFGILELETPRFRALRIANTALDSLQNFYKNGLETSPFNDLFFEKSIQSFNKHLIELLNQEKIIFNALNFNILIAASLDHDIHFSWHGRVSGFLIHADATGKRHLINLENKFEKEISLNTSPTKILRQILSGKIQPNNYLLFINHKLDPAFDKTVFNAFGKLELEKLLPSLRQTLIDASLGPQAIILVENPATSIHEPNKIKAKQSLFPDIVRKVFFKIINSGVRIFRVGVNLLVLALVYATNWKGRRGEARAIFKNKINRLIEPKIMSFNDRPSLFKILSIISLTLVFVFLQSVFIQLRFSNAQNKSQGLETEIKSLDSRIIEIQGIITYGDFTGGQAALRDLIQEIADLSPRARKLQSFNELVSYATATWQQAWRIEAIDSLNNIVDEAAKNKIKNLKNNGVAKITFENLGADFDSQTIWANKNSKYLYILSNDRARLAVFNKKTELVRQYEPKGLGKIGSFAINEGAKSGYLIQDDKIYQFQLTHLEK